ncbi:MAG TPA: TrkA family potassium uptake protein [Actinomycetes bacterium]|nr:TrkA family potassium uptake protein [Actinomycetes bacterium]
MHVVIMGCGRVGASIAHDIDESGHSVVVIDQDPASFRKLGPGFTGTTITGVGFDRDTLIEAGIERADAFAAVSSGDNSNIVSARVARETFGVSRVVARIYDPRRAEIYQRLGIPTVATVRWSAHQILRQLLPGGVHEDYRDPSGRIVLAQMHVNPAWVGLGLRRLEQENSVRVAFVTRLGEGILPKSDSVLQDGDLLHVLVPESDASRAERSLARAPESA